MATGAVHIPGAHDEDHGRAVPLANFERRFFVGGKVHVVTFAAVQAFRANGGEKARGRSVIEEVGWNLRSIAKRYLDRVTLVRTDAQPVLAVGEALFVAGGDDEVECSAIEHFAMAVAGLDQGGDVDPSGGVERQADAFGLVSQYETEKLARSGELLIIHNQRKMLLGRAKEVRKGRAEKVGGEAQSDRNAA